MACKGSGVRVPSAPLDIRHRASLSPFRPGPFRAPLPAIFVAFFLALPALPARAQPQAIDLQVTVFSMGGGGRDTIAVAYAKTPTDAEIRTDFNTMAADLKAFEPKLKISRDEGITVAEAELSGLTN